MRPIGLVVFTKLKSKSAVLANTFKAKLLGLFSPAGDLANRRLLVQGLAGTLGLKVLGKGLAIIVSVFLARLLKPEGYGTYALGISVVTLLAVPVEMGLPTLIVRETARYLQAAELGLLRGLLRRANQAGLLLGLVVGGVLYGATFILGAGLTLESTLRWAAFLLPLIALKRIREAALRGGGHVVLGRLPETTVLPVAFLLLLLGFQLSGRVGPPQAMALYLSANAFAFIAGGILLWRSLTRALRYHDAEFESVKWAKSLMPLALLSGVFVFNSQIDMLMLGFLAPRDELGVYRVAASGAALVVFILQVVNHVIAPEIARLYQAGDREAMQRVVTAGSRLMLLGGVPVALLFVFAGKPVIHFAYGSEYVSAYVPLVILSLGQLANAAVGSVGNILNMTGHESDTVRAVAIGSAINIVLSMILIPPLGAIGAGIAAAVSMGAWNVLLFRKVRDRLGIHSLAVSRRT